VSWKVRPAKDRSKQRRTRLVGEHGARQCALPGPEDERGGAVGSHGAVEAGELALRRLGQRVRRARAAQPGQQARRGKRLHVGLHAREVLDGVARGGPAAAPRCAAAGTAGSSRS
jgi:hypothetical protein